MTENRIGNSTDSASGCLETAAVNVGPCDMGAATTPDLPRRWPTRLNPRSRGGGGRGELLRCSR